MHEFFFSNIHFLNTSTFKTQFREDNNSVHKIHYQNTPLELMKILMLFRSLSQIHLEFLTLSETLFESLSKFLTLFKTLLPKHMRKFLTLFKTLFTTLLEVLILFKTLAKTLLHITL